MSYLLGYSFLLPLLVACITFRKFNGNHIKLVLIVVFYCIIFFSLNQFSTETYKFLGRYNYFLIYTSLEYLSFALIAAIFISNRKFSILVIVLSSLFIVFTIIYYTTARFKRIDSIPIGVESILLFVYVFIYFYSLIQKFDYQLNLYERASFWFIVGIFIYLGTTFFFNILGNAMDKELIDSYFHYTYLGDIVKNIFFSIGILLIPKTPEFRNDKKNGKDIPYLDMIQPTTTIN